MCAEMRAAADVYAQLSHTSLSRVGSGERSETDHFIDGEAENR